MNYRAEVLIDYLKKQDPNHWSTEEELIAALPGFFKAKPRPNATQLDGNIYATMRYIQDNSEQFQILIINNRKRAYKIATFKEADIYLENLRQKRNNLNLRIWQILEIMNSDSTFDLITEEFKEVYKE